MNGVIWQNPWAWAGLATVVLPVLIHLLGRRRAPVQPFPTLRFLVPSPQLATRRTKLHDLLLLALRVATLTAAVAALAQPLLRSAASTRHYDATLARAIIVDTSASMRRITSTGESGLAAARRSAADLANSANTHATLSAAMPADALAGAVAWLATEAGRRELVVVSDFQLGTIAPADLAAVPAAIGIRLVKVDVHPDSASEIVTSRGDQEVVARVTAPPGATDVVWSVRPAPPNRAAPPVLLLAGPGDAGARDAALRAAWMAGSPVALDPIHAAAIVYPDYPARAALVHDARQPLVPWMADLVVRLARDSLLAAATAAATPVGDSASGLVVVRNAAAQPIIVAAPATVDGRQRLVLFARATAGSLPSAALIAATLRAGNLAPPASELEPLTLADSVLQRFQRPPAAAGAAPVNTASDVGPSDGRWLWIVALALLAVETVIRRRAPLPLPAAGADVA